MVQGRRRSSWTPQMAIVAGNVGYGMAYLKVASVLPSCLTSYRQLLPGSRTCARERPNLHVFLFRAMALKAQPEENNMLGFHLSNIYANQVLTINVNGNPINSEKYLGVTLGRSLTPQMRRL